MIHKYQFLKHKLQEVRKKLISWWKTRIIRGMLLIITSLNLGNFLIRLIIYRLNLRNLGIGKLLFKQVLLKVKEISPSMINLLLILELKMMPFRSNSEILMIKLIDLTHKLEISKSKLEEFQSPKPKKPNYWKTLLTIKTELISKRKRTLPQT